MLPRDNAKLLDRLRDPSFRDATQPPFRHSRERRHPRATSSFYGPLLSVSAMRAEAVTQIEQRLALVRYLDL
jgi:hypothetical protein